MNTYNPPINEKILCVCGYSEIVLNISAMDIYYPNRRVYQKIKGKDEIVTCKECGNSDLIIFGYTHTIDYTFSNPNIAVSNQIFLEKTLEDVRKKKEERDRLNLINFFDK